MSELKRWLDDAPSDEIRRLLAVARDEDAPPRLLHRTLAALGTTSAAAGASAASAASKLGMLGVLLKWGGAGLVGGTLVAGAVAGVTRIAATHATTPPRTRVVLAKPLAPATNPTPELPRTGAGVPAMDGTTTATNAVPATDGATTPRLDATTATSGATTATTGVQSTNVAHAKNDAPPSVTPPAYGALPPPPAAAALAADSGAATAREVALVDAARVALHRGDGAGTLHLLGDYEHRFSPAHLEPEVLFLRMQAAKVQGDEAGARGAAARIVTQFPQSPEAGRAEELLHGDASGAKE